MEKVQSFIGLIVLIIFSWLVGVLINKLQKGEKGRINFRVVGGCLFLQFAVAILFLKVTWVRDTFMVLNYIAKAMQEACLAGTKFAFGYVGGGGMRRLKLPHLIIGLFLLFRAYLWFCW